MQDLRQGRDALAGVQAVKLFTEHGGPSAAISNFKACNYFGPPRVTFATGAAGRSTIDPEL